METAKLLSGVITLAVTALLGVLLDRAKWDGLGSVTATPFGLEALQFSGQLARLVEVVAATLLAGGFVPAALLRDVHGARNRRARQREAGRSRGLLGQRSTCDQEPDRGGGEQQDRPKVRQSYRWRIAVTATSS
jgi:hypothetical protein